MVTATVDPAPIPQLIDRLLVVAEANSIQAAVVVNKIELDPGRELIERCRAAGYVVYPTSAKTGEGIEAFAAALAGRISVVTGPSGAGKSSLLNAVQPGLKLRIGELSAKVRRGKNTTVSAVMIPLHAGGYLVDTPGFSEVGLWGVVPRELAHLLSRDAAVHRRMPLRRLPAHDRAGLPGARRRWRRARSGRIDGRATGSCWGSWRARRRNGSRKA